MRNMPPATHAPGVLASLGLHVLASIDGSVGLRAKGRGTQVHAHATEQGSSEFYCRLCQASCGSSFPLPWLSSAMEPLRDAAREIQLRLLGRFTVANVLDDESLTGISRDLDMVELWAGVMSVTFAGRRRGYRAVAFDLVRVPGTSDVPGPKSEDLTSEVGFVNALTLVLRLRVGALLGMSPVCSSFVFSNMVNTKRHKANPQGDVSYPSVAAGNTMAHAAAFFMAVALARGVHFYLENPAGSLMFQFLGPEIRQFPSLRTCIAHRCAYSDEPMGARVLKPYKFLTSGAWLVPRRCVCGDAGHEPLMLKGRSGVTGNARLMRDSAAYPAALGEHIVAAWESAAPVQSLCADSGGRDVLSPPPGRLRARPGTKAAGALRRPKRKSHGACRQGRPISRHRSPSGPWGNSSPIPRGRSRSPSGPWAAPTPGSPSHLLLPAACASGEIASEPESEEGPWG